MVAVLLELLLAFRKRECDAAEAGGRVFPAVIMVGD